ncbi:alpha-glucosidase [Motilibacter peucedani]|uniref:Alpha-glucosidase n=1 Tax=Motilibacter peucedani TaxID=598650 RepID=A0A420XNM5_9ACTN|nr:glycoside hydrolase family 13 protein [Motilibacter peucedani]RKS73801.1 alpha-glucosidase [Motilibacter peucedani]
MSSPSAPWWRDAVIYQVYVRSFADSDGDGLGDLPGVRAHLDHLRDLGVDALWLNPFYPSPQNDAGYDVSDYRDVEPRFGTLADADALVTEAHERGLRVIVDLVPNHTSSEHVWFRAALAAPRGSRERSRYLFRDGRGDDGSVPPNDWVSVFGGPAWSRVTEPDGRPGQWYLHLFDATQPDLDWTNSEVVEEFHDVLRFWLERGVDGFRIDVAHGLAKDQDMPDIDGRFATSGPAEHGHPHWDQDEVHEVYRGWRGVLDRYDGDRTFVAEAWVATAERLALYLRPDELHTAFNFPYLLAPWSAPELVRVIDETLDALREVGAPATWVLSNHDVVRHATRFGGGAVGVRRARAASALMLALPGGAYVYQGEELGLEEVLDLPDEARQDPTFARTHGEEKGRDGCRVPIPWSGAEAPFGFGPAGSTPWLPQPASWGSLTVEAQDGDPGSTLELYRRLLRVRKASPALGEGTLAWVETGSPEVLAFVREPGFLCVANTGAQPAAVPAQARGARVLVSSSPVEEDGVVPADTTVWYATG